MIWVVGCGNCGKVFYEEDDDMPKPSAWSAASCDDGCGFVGITVRTPKDFTGASAK